MLRSFYVIIIYCAFIGLGMAVPFVFSLGYVWVDTFSPQMIATQWVDQIPVSMIMAIFAIAAYIFIDRRKGNFSVTSAMLIVFAIWVTLSTAFWAEVPASAWTKWNPAFKTICFAAFLPFVFRSRVQIEALMQVYLFSICVHFIPGGLKTMVSGGGYGRALGIIQGNSLLAEGSTLSAVALMLIPLILWLRKYNLLMPKTWMFNLGYLGLVAVALAAAVGTYERTALIGMVVVGFGLWLRSNRKILFGILGVAGVALAATLTSHSWTERISTIQTYNTEESALTRLLVWRWTIDFARSHPFGGGFNSYMIDHIVFPTARGQPTLERTGVAFHSIYFELLGEQGYVGVAIFGAIIAWSFYQLQRVGRLTRGIADLTWARDLSFAVQTALSTLLVCGSFIGIAFQPMIYFLVVLATCLQQHVRQILKLAAHDHIVIEPGDLEKSPLEAAWQ